MPHPQDIHKFITSRQALIYLDHKKTKEFCYFSLNAVCYLIHPDRRARVFYRIQFQKNHSVF